MREFFSFLGPTGVLIQQHHYQAVPAQIDHPFLDRSNTSLDRSFSESVKSQALSSMASIAALHECN